MAEPVELISVDDAETAPAPQQGGIFAEDQNHLNNLLFAAQNVGKYVEAYNQIRMGILRLAKPTDWVVFKAGEKETAELTFGGANRIRSTFGISFPDDFWKEERTAGRDENGEWYRWEYSAKAVWRTQELRVFGRASTRDVFFGKSHGEWKQMKDINEVHVKNAAYHNCIKEGVKMIMGLHRMDPKELEEHGITMSRAMGHGFKNAQEVSDTIETQTVKVEDVTFKKTEKWTKYTIKDEGGAIYHTFNKNLAEKAKDAKGKGVGVTISFKTGKFGRDITALDLDYTGGE